MHHLGAPHKVISRTLGVTEDSARVLANREKTTRGLEWRKSPEEWAKWIKVQRIMMDHCKDHKIDFHALPLSEWTEMLEALESVLADKLGQ